MSNCQIYPELYCHLSSVINLSCAADNELCPRQYREYSGGKKKIPVWTFDPAVFIFIWFLNEM